MSPNILFYDIETSLMKAWLFQLGDQAIRHHQLVEGYNRQKVICIAYCFNNGPVKIIDWGYEKQNDARVIMEFDKIIKQADIIIGKNSDKFDNKTLNFVRMVTGQPGMPTWVKSTDDLEKQMRKYFRMPSYSLDYISQVLGLGGKKKMEFSDWVEIGTKAPGTGIKAFKKMLSYCAKDVRDTRSIWNYCKHHFEPKFNVSTFLDEPACKHCHGTDVVKNGTRLAGLTRWQEYFCRRCGMYAGRTPMKSKLKSNEKLR